MSINSYLASRASNAILSDAEQASINTSIGALKGRLGIYFGATLTTHFRFGSSARGTILPRKMDESSDIDYMVVFNDGGFNPQTYLNRLRKFADTYYSSSEFKQSSPSITLELNHIKFDLVPAVTNIWGGGYRIPSSQTTWQDTNPNDFNSSLISKNIDNHFMIKPTIRLLKFWNALNGYVFESFLLEKWVVQQSYWLARTQRDYFFQSIDKLPVPSDTQWRREKVERAKKIIAKARALDAQGFPYLAQAEIQKLIPS